METQAECQVPFAAYCVVNLCLKRLETFSDERFSHFTFTKV